MATNSTAAMIRRFVAVGLTLLSVLFLFWPAMVCIRDEKLRDLMEEQYETYKESLEEEDHEDAYELYEDFFGEDDAKAYVNASYAAKFAYKPDKSLSDLRTATTASWKALTILDKHDLISLDDYSDKEKSNYFQNIVVSVVLNIVFFGMLLTAVGACVLYFFNKTRAVGIIHAILAFLGAGAVLVYLIRTNQTYAEYDLYSDPVLTIGAGMILLPLFSLAACIVYQRDKNLRGLFPKAASEAPSGAPVNPYANPNPYAAPAYRQPVPTGNAWNPPAAPSRDSWNSAPETRDNLWSRPSAQPATRTYAQAPVPTAEDGWNCPQCEAHNPSEAMFCPVCGSKKPEPRPAAETAFCPNCGTKLDGSSRFCPCCGTKL